jgi:hypothetical protein
MPGFTNRRTPSKPPGFRSRPLENVEMVRRHLRLYDGEDIAPVLGSSL